MPQHKALSIGDLRAAFSCNAQLDTIACLEAHILRNQNRKAPLVRLAIEGRASMWSPGPPKVWGSGRCQAPHRAVRERQEAGRVPSCLRLLPIFPERIGRRNSVASVALRRHERPNNRVWSDEDRAVLRQHIAAGGSAFRAAVKFKRSEAAVCDQARQMGLRFPTIQQLRKKAAGAEAATEES